MKEEVKETKTEKKENKNKWLLSLEPVLTEKLEAKLKPRVKEIYYAFLVLFAISLLGALGIWGAAGFASFILSLAFIGLNFIVVRMWAEYLNNK